MSVGVKVEAENSTSTLQDTQPPDSDGRAYLVCELMPMMEDHVLVASKKDKLAGK